MSKVSIIVPCYNVEMYLPRCMESLLRQTLHDIEIILVDDGSPDHCSQLCDKYARLDNRVKVIHKTNGGLGYARNSGLEVATGEYIGFIDSDDYADTEMFHTLYEEATQSDADAVFCNFRTERAQGVWHVNREVDERREWVGTGIRNFMLDMVASAPGVSVERRFQMSVWHSIYRREIIEKHCIRFHSEREVSSEDFPFQMDFLLHSSKIVFLPNVFYSYCLNGTSLTHTFNPDKFRRIRNLYELMCGQLHDVEGAQQRLDRFYIGYVRSRICDMIVAKYEDCYSVLNGIMNDEIWNSVDKRYPVCSLPLYPRIIHRMICGRHRLSLIILFKMIIWMKKKH